MSNLADRMPVDLGGDLTDALDGYFERLNSVPCVTIADELVRTLAQFRDAAVISGDLAEFRARCRNHPLHRLALEDPFTARMFAKPRGYSTDPVALDYILRPRYLALSEIGEAVHFETTRVGTARSVVGRRDYLAKAIAQIVRRVRKARILSVANGHLRELDVLRRLLGRRDFHIMALDPDRAALREAVNANPDFNITPLEQPISYLLDDRAAEYDLIYSTGALDDLADEPAAQLLDRLGAQLSPGGKLIMANYAQEHYGRGYIDGIMGWSVRSRSESELERLAHSSKLGPTRIYRDALGNIIYLEASPRI